MSRSAATTVVLLGLVLATGMAAYCSGWPLLPDPPALQTTDSPWPARRFHYGPAEWLWRSMTYGPLQPMRRHAVRPRSPGGPSLTPEAA